MEDTFINALDAIPSPQEACERKLVTGFDDAEVLARFLKSVDHVNQARKEPLPFKPRVVVLEGLDGCGKSTACATLVKALVAAKGAADVRASRTPTASLDEVRQFFDGLKAMTCADRDRVYRAKRAFYLLSNYVLQNEMIEECAAAQKSLIFVVDRYYSSTASYSAGQETTTLPEVDALPLPWPEDLLRPDVILVLCASPAKREARAKARGADEFKAYERLLEEDPALGERIVRAMLRMPGSVAVNADQPADAVAADCLRHALACLSTPPAAPLVAPLPAVKVAPAAATGHTTVFLLGTHASGKSTLGRALAGRLGYAYQDELGNRLRGSEKEKMADGHRGGYHAGWDARVFAAEEARDGETEGSRVVETWHVGNCLWAWQRHGEGEEEEYARPDVRQRWVDRTRRAVDEEHRRGRRVLYVLLKVRYIEKYMLWVDQPGSPI